MKKYSKWLLILFISIVIIKVILSQFVQTISGFSDEYFYAKMARSFFVNMEFTVHNVQVAQYPPLYSILLSIAYIFKNMNYVYFFIKFINAILSSLIIFPAWLLSKEFLEEKKAFITSLLISILPSNFAFSPYIMAENLYYPLFLFAIYGIYKSTKPLNYKWPIITGIIAGLAYLTKISALVIPTTFLITSLIIIFKSKRYFFEIKKFLVFIIPFLSLASLWSIRNGYLFGFSLSGILGSYSQSELSHGFVLDKLIIWIILYLGYLLLSSLFIYTIFSLQLIKKKEYSNLLVISAITVILTIIMAANHNVGAISLNSFFLWLPGRPLGRYVDVLMPLIVILGMIGLNQKEKISKKWFFILSPIVIFSSLLMFFPLFPLNNLSLSWLGVLSVGVNYFVNNLLIQWILFTIFISMLFLLIYKFTKLNPKKIVLGTIIFFMLLGFLNYAIISYNSKTYWANGDQFKMGQFMNEFDPLPSNILLDSRYDATISKNDQTGIYQNLSSSYSSSIIGFWLNDNLFIGNPEELNKDIDYIYTKTNLNKKLIKRIGDFRIYSSKDL